MASLSDIYKQAMPAHQRLFLESIGKSAIGRTDIPITEKDFTPEELGQFRQLMEYHNLFPGNAFGPKHTIADYDEYQRLTDYIEPKSEKEAYPYTTDLPQRLGRFQYEDVPGGYRIKDTYDFKNPARKRQTSLLGMLKDAAKRYEEKGVHGAAGALGEYMLYDNGVPVDIFVPRK